MIKKKKSQSNPKHSSDPFKQPGSSVAIPRSEQGPQNVEGGGGTGGFRGPVGPPMSPNLGVEAMLMDGSNSSEHPRPSPFNAASSKRGGLENSCWEPNPRFFGGSLSPRSRVPGNRPSPAGSGAALCARCPCPSPSPAPLLAGPRCSEDDPGWETQKEPASCERCRLPACPRVQPRIRRGSASAAPWGWVRSSRRRFWGVPGCRRQEGTGGSPWCSPRAGVGSGGVLAPLDPGYPEV